MFDAETYARRRDRLKAKIGEGVLLFMGNQESPMNYPANPYHFRQDSSFLYFFGLDSPDLAGLIDVDEGRDILFGDDMSVDDIIWMGDQAGMPDRAAQVGIETTLPRKKLIETLKDAVRKGRKIHFQPPYRPETLLRLQDLLGIQAEQIKNYVSEALVKAVVAQRSIKSAQEIEQIELALDASHAMHTTAMRMAKAGIRESEIAGVIEGIALSFGGNIAFPIILTINGQILHNHDHSQTLEPGRLVVNDSGAESPMHYASDITRTFPVGGRFTGRQKEVYSIVLEAQKSAIESIRPGVMNKEVHLRSARIIAGGLKDLGVMQGDVDEAVNSGAHALFMPHGLGHMLGLDVHDMEDLGEKYVGYDRTVRRSDQFGLAFLRLAKKLKAGYVLTVEPGIYFIPALIDKWMKEDKFPDFIDYGRVNRFRDFGGIRIEDDVLVTEDGCRVLGKPIPKSIEELREIVGSG